MLVKLFLRVLFIAAIITAHLIKKYDVDPNVKEVSGAFFRKHDDVISYESSAKLIIRIKLPFLQHLALPKGPGQHDTISQIQETTSMALQRFWSYVHGHQKRERPKRQIVAAAAAGAFLGYELKSVLTNMYHKFTGTESDAEGRITELRKSLAQSRNEHLLFVNDFTEFSRNLTVTINKLLHSTSEFDRADLWLLHLIQTLTTISNVESGLDRCFHKHIPFQLLDSKVVREHLDVIQKRISPFGYELSIPAENVAEYELVKIADCFVTTENIYLLANVPIRKNNWKISEMIPVPFAYGSSTCSLANTNSEMMAVTRDKMVIIDEFMRSSCDLSKDRLCFVPPFSRRSAQRESCVQGMYQNARAEILSKSCEFKCINSTDMDIIEVEKNTIVVTFAKTIMVRCPEKHARFNVRDFGAVQVVLKCNCSYVIDDYEIDSMGMCLDERFEDDDVLAIVPYFINDPDNEAKKHGKNWTDLVASITHLPRQIQTFEYENFGPIHYRDFWSGVLSLLVFILIICGSLAFCWARKHR